MAPCCAACFHFPIMARLLSNMKRIRAECISPQKKTSPGERYSSISSYEECTWSSSVPPQALRPVGLPPHHRACSFLYVEPLSSTLGRKDWTENSCCETHAERMPGAGMLGAPQEFKDCSLHNKSSTWEREAS